MYNMTDSLFYVETYQNGLRKDGLNLQALSESLGLAFESLLGELLFMACSWFKEQGLEGKVGKKVAALGLIHSTHNCEPSAEYPI